LTPERSSLHARTAPPEPSESGALSTWLFAAPHSGRHSASTAPPRAVEPLSADVVQPARASDQAASRRRPDPTAVLDARERVHAADHGTDAPRTAPAASTRSAWAVFATTLFVTASRLS
jgi:hypothetical protein